jgi:hypothetical protein
MSNKDHICGAVGKRRQAPHDHTPLDMSHDHRELIHPPGSSLTHRSLPRTARSVPLLQPQLWQP